MLYINGFCLILTKTILKKNKLSENEYFSNKLPFAGNDKEWFERVTSNGSKAFICRKTWVYHHKSHAYKFNSDILIDKRNDESYNFELEPSKPEIKTAFYTACIDGQICNDYEKQMILSSNTDYYLFSDKEIYIKGFKTILIKKYIENDNVRSARYIKINPHKFFKYYDNSIWMDSRLSPKFVDSNIIINSHLSNNCNIAFFKHYCRNCVYEEANEIIESKKDYQNIVNLQMEKYRNDNYPSNNGLFETGFLIRDHNNPTIIDLMKKWWIEVENFSRRDQLSINYLINKNNMLSDIIETYTPIKYNYVYDDNGKHMNIRKNKYVTMVKHLCRKNNKII